MQETCAKKKEEEENQKKNVLIVIVIVKYALVLCVLSYRSCLSVLSINHT